MTTDKSAVEHAKVRKLTPLRGSETNDEDPGESSALRDIHRWVTDRAKYIGVQVKNLIYRAFDANPEIEGKLLKSLVHSTNSDILDSPWMNEPRERDCKALDQESPPRYARVL